MKVAFVLGGAALLACASKSPAPTSEQLAQGGRAYQKCYSCHAIEPGKNDLPGPTLHGIVGRAVAAEPGFDYSPALKGFGRRHPRWTKELIDRFAADPESLVPGTAMSFRGIDDADEREALIAYLEHQTSANAASLP